MYNNVIIRAGDERYVAVYAVIVQISMTAMAVYNGVGQAAQPILAVAAGAGLPDRIRKVFRHGVLLELIGTGALALLYIALAGPIANLLVHPRGRAADPGDDQHPHLRAVHPPDGNL